MLILFTAFAYGAGSASPIYKISISLPKQTFRLGEPVLAHVSLKNVSDGMITIGFAIGFQQAEASYRITLTDKLGHQLTPRWSIREAGQISKPFVFRGLLWTSLQMKLLRKIA
jgi:hypothetical protein